MWSQRPTIRACIILALVLVIASPVHSGAIRSGFSSASLPASDDSSSGAVNMGFTVNFLGQSHGQVFVNNNGNISFAAAIDAFTPSNLSNTAHQIIAPFFADVDTSVAGSVTYGTGLVEGRQAFAATWTGVGYYLANSDKTNDFQVVLIDRSDIGVGNFDLEFNYNRIQWETGDFSGGVDGLGGSSARAGWAKGTADPGTAFELSGSGINGAFLDGGPADTSLIAGSLNSDVDGRYRFFGRNGSLQTTVPDGEVDDPVIDEPPPPVPEPSTLLLVLSGGIGYRLWRRGLAKREQSA